jgi:hypothetical protein
MARRAKLADMLERSGGASPSSVSCMSPIISKSSAHAAPAVFTFASPSTSLRRSHSSGALRRSCKSVPWASSLRRKPAPGEPSETHMVQGPAHLPQDLVLEAEGLAMHVRVANAPVNRHIVRDLAHRELAVRVGECAVSACLCVHALLVYCAA